MFYLNSPPVLYLVVLHIGYFLHQLVTALLQLVPVPAFATQWYGQSTMLGDGGRSIMPSLAVALPNFHIGGKRRSGARIAGASSNTPTLVQKDHVSDGGEKRDRSNDWKTRQLWVDATTLGHLHDLVAAIEAKGPSELIRRALRAREYVYPEDAEFGAIITALQSNQDERLSISLPPSSWERVDRLKQETGKTFRTLVYEAILVFAELQARSEELEKGDQEVKDAFLF